jgi:hypothetical protein
MQTAIICRNCGHADLLEVSTAEEQDLLTVGMFERACPACKRETRWGRGVELRRKERRFRERRRSAKATPAPKDKRGKERRKQPRRHTGT